MARNIAKRFQIKVLKDYKVTRIKMRRNPNKADDGIPFLTETEEVTLPESYMVFFPNGHSVFFENKTLMAQAGLTEDANFEVDMETGEAVVPPKANDLEALVARKTRNTRQHVGV